MANRDIGVLNTVTQVESEQLPNPAMPRDNTTIMNQAIDLATGIIKENQQAKITETFTKAQMDLNQIQNDYQLKYEQNPMTGFEKYKEQRQKVLDTYGNDISPVFKRYWQDTAIKLSQQDDISQQGWVLKQTKLNTVAAVNKSMENSFKLAYTNGKNFANADTTDYEAYLKFKDAQDQLKNFGYANLGQNTTDTMVKNMGKDGIKSFLTGVAEVNPQKAAMMIQDKKIQETFTPDELDTFEKVIRKQEKQNKLGSLYDQINNENNLMDTVLSPEGDYFAKRLEVDKAEMSGSLSPDSASAMRRVLTSKKSIDAVTSNQAFADVIDQLYDLNAIADMDSEGYLTGIQNIRNDLAAKQEQGLLNAQDALKLNNRISTLTSKRIADATQQVGMEFYDAQQVFNTLPPEYRGMAKRQLFYQTADLGDAPKEKYKQIANKIADDMNAKIRTETFRKIENPKTIGVKHPYYDFLKTTKNPATGEPFTITDIKETAKNRGYTEEYVIELLKGKK